MKLADQPHEILFLIDTGSDVSLVKLDSLSPQTKVNTDNKIFIRGITGKEEPTLGSISEGVVVCDNIYTHEFHVIPSAIPLETSGIIGKDFLQKYNIGIDFKNNSLCFPTEDKTGEIKAKIIFDNSEKEQKEIIEKVCQDFDDLFFIEGEHLSCTNAITHKIPIFTNQPPISVKPYRLPESHREVITKTIKELLASDIISPSNSPWNAPLLVVPKKSDGSCEKDWRVVVDYRKLNEATIGDAYPIPNIIDILDRLGNSQYFSTIDLASGYHQIEVDPSDRHKTAFSTNFGHYEFNRMPFGLKGAPATFQRLMNQLLTGLVGSKCFVYLDDIIVVGKTFQEHKNNIIDVFNKLRDAKLKIKPSKCHFLKQEINFLGHIITNKGIKPDPSKIEVVKNYPIPKNIKDIQSFLGLANYYRRFIKDFSKVAQPMTALLKKNVKYNWCEKCDTAFNTLKNLLTTPPILQYPDYSEEFIVTTDASQTALGAVLSQGEIGKDRPICFNSRTLNKAESRYSTIERELLAIVWAIHTYRPYLFGVRFTVVTDHKPLVWMYSLKDPSSRLLRWQIKIAEYDFQVVYKPGKYNSNADALSRRPLAINKVLTRQALNNIATNSDSVSKADEDQPIQFLTDEREQNRIVKQFHSAPLGGHQGTTRTLKRLKNYYKWENMETDVKNFIDNCELCQRNKFGRYTKEPMKITTTASKPFEKVFLDIVGPLTPKSHSNNSYVLTFQDDLTKFSEAIALENAEAYTVAEAFVTRIICIHGIPQIVLTDQGTNFLSDVFKNVCKLLKIKKVQTTPYHPQTNGALERSHRTLAEY